MHYHSLNEETVVLKDFNLVVNEGEFIALLGPSGCGKSTILSLAAGLHKPDRGTVLLRGKEIESPPLEMGYMLQKDHLFSWLTVRQNAFLGLRVRKRLTEETMAQVDRLLHTCGLTGFADFYPQQLSGGMRQRAALVRTLAMDPQFLLLDEPFSALDAQTRLKIADEVATQIKIDHRAAILVSHDISELMSRKRRPFVESLMIIF